MENRNEDRDRSLPTGSPVTTDTPLATSKATPLRKSTGLPTSSKTIGSAMESAKPIGTGHSQTGSNPGSLMPTSRPAVVSLPGSQHAALQSCEAWLRAWQPGETVDYPRAMIQTIRSRINLRPASPQAFSVMMDRLWQFAETFDMPTPKIEQASAIYTQTLGDLPEDLLEKAIDRIKAEWRYRSLPKPGDIKATVAEDLAKRMLMDGRARMAIRQAKT